MNPITSCSQFRFCRAGISALLSGDKSQWDRALQMPHYNTYSMPALSFHTGNHFLQVRRAVLCCAALRPTVICFGVGDVTSPTSWMASCTGIRALCCSTIHLGTDVFLFYCVKTSSRATHVQLMCCAGCC